MTIRQLKNISISKFESFLELACCKYIRTKGGHLIYTRSDCNRPITFQSHIDPVPEFIIKNCLRSLNYSKEDFFDIIELHKIVEKKDNKYQLKKNS